jgi:hypothetical protein
MRDKVCAACGLAIPKRPMESRVTCGKSECQERESQQNRERNAIRSLRKDQKVPITGRMGAVQGFVMKHSAGTYFMRSENNKERARWGSLLEILSDVAHFHIHGELPSASEASRW